ncbi:hypothetical protein AQUCO_07800009v1 [Aquilegia coerulea]|uniref:Uncharacterized protein n=1 Tax=Aquilegia coerulea TaxID=218851 RepID=A0A2G5C7Z5_AQUCA|nr:hypothetical protein AQUCO_07800009v1 [Aquilegia coerulea]
MSFNYNGEALCERSTLAECSVDDSATLFLVEPAELVFSSVLKEETGNGELVVRDVEGVTEVKAEGYVPCVNVLVSFANKVRAERDVDTQSNKKKKVSFPLRATKVSFPHVDTQANKKKKVSFPLRATKVSFPLRATKSLAAKGPEKDPPGILLLSIANKVLPKSEAGKHSNKKNKVSFTRGRTNVDNVPDPSAEASLWEKIRMAKSPAERAEKKLAAKVPENLQVVNFLTSVKDALKFCLRHRRFFLCSFKGLVVFPNIILQIVFALF